MIYDFHTHTSLSDGLLSPMELISEALSHNYRVLGISDHAGVGFLPRIIEETARDCELAEKYWGIKVLPGVELTHLPEKSIAETARKAKDSGATFVVVHGETISEHVEPGTNLAAVSCVDVDILAHPGFITLEEAKIAAANNIYIEISARKGHSFTNGYIVRIAKLAGAKLIVNSDAHDTGDLLTATSAYNVAQGAGLEEKDISEVLTTNPLALLNKLKIQL